MSARELQAGYAAWAAGKPLEHNRPADWREGWLAGDDGAWWKALAERLGCQIIGFSYRHGATLAWPTGETSELRGALLRKVCELVGHRDRGRLPKGEGDNGPS